MVSQTTAQIVSIISLIVVILSIVWLIYTIIGFALETFQSNAPMGTSRKIGYAIKIFIGIFFECGGTLLLKHFSRFLMF